jgi:hypothetical protein
MTEDEAIVRLILWQREHGFTTMPPGRGYTERTEAGWAFFNIRGYLGTVTDDGEIIGERGHAHHTADYDRGWTWIR